MTKKQGSPDKKTEKAKKKVAGYAIEYIKEKKDLPFKSRLAHDQTKQETRVLNPNKLKYINTKTMRNWSIIHNPIIN